MDREVFWQRERPPALGPPLEGRASADVVIVGGGMAGLSCALRLCREGVATIVVERDFCGAGASGRSSGFITPASEIELASLIALHGAAQARRLWEFVTSGVELIRAFVVEHGLACDFEVQDSLCVATNERGIDTVQSEHAARAQLGLPSTLHDQRGLASVLGTQRYLGGVRYGRTFALDSYALVRGLRGVLERRGVRVFERSGAVRLREHGIDTARGSVDARHVVVCGDRFIPELGALRQELDHVQTFLAMSRPLPADAFRRVFPGAPVMTWDTDLIYHYFRPARGERILLGGAKLAYTYSRSPPCDLGGVARGLAEFFRERFPGVPLELDCVWSGMLGVSKDLLPLMGPDPARESIWYVGAATGLPWAAALGDYAAERILRGRSELDEALSPRRRFPIGPRLQRCLSKPVAFALSHRAVKRAK